MTVPCSLETSSSRTNRTLAIQSKKRSGLSSSPSDSQATTRGACPNDSRGPFRSPRRRAVATPSSAHAGWCQPGLMSPQMLPGARPSRRCLPGRGGCCASMNHGPSSRHSLVQASGQAGTATSLVAEDKVRARSSPSTSACPRSSLQPAAHQPHGFSRSVSVPRSLALKPRCFATRSGGLASRSCAPGTTPKTASHAVWQRPMAQPGGSFRSRIQTLDHLSSLRRSRVDASSTFNTENR